MTWTNPTRRRPSLSDLSTLLLGAVIFAAFACSSKPDERGPEPPRDGVPLPAPKAAPGSPSPASPAPDEVAPEATKTAPAPDPAGTRQKPLPHKGPWLWVTQASAAVYKSPNPLRTEKLGYVKRGGQIPIASTEKVTGQDCSRGWYAVASGGFVCSHVGTTDQADKDVKFRPNQPNTDEILPYRYARNATNGTPLYKSIPTTKQMFQYEPYLPGAIKEREALEKEKAEDLRQMKAAGLGLGGSSGEAPGKRTTSKPSTSKQKVEAKVSKVRPSTESAKKAPPKNAPKTKEEPKKDEVPLWEREEGLHEVTLEDLRKDRDEILEQRMMKGFYVAIDKTFKWEARTWYKTTKGLITPADRFYQTAGSDFQGVVIDGDKVKLPLGWVFGNRESSATYEIDTDANKATPKGTKKNFESVQLEYGYHQIGTTEYFPLTDGTWIRDAHIRMTTPGERPPEVGATERWIDIDISEQTLVVFEGDRPVYATLISSGKESTVKEKDHSTPRGMWRVREKHIAATMDGDGSAAGDLPYSIEDVPYIMYFHKSYATHGAFWHRNYGSQMSHGCVNLAPLDAKWLFFYADPQVPEGFHGNWATDTNPGSMVVIHD